MLHSIHEYSLSLHIKCGLLFQNDTSGLIAIEVQQTTRKSAPRGTRREYMGVILYLLLSFTAVTTIIIEHDITAKNVDDKSTRLREK